MRTPDLMPWPEGRPPEPSLCGEDVRASILAAYGLDELVDDPELSDIVRFAAELCGADVVLVSIVERERQRFLAREGLEEHETPRPTSFCAHTMLRGEPMEVPDARLDPRFEDNPLVLGHPHIRFYAGAPLISGEGAPIGSLCVIGNQPRPEGLSDMQRRGLKVLAGGVMRRLRHRREALAARAAGSQYRKRIETLIDVMPQIAWSADSEGNFDYFNQQWYDLVGGQPPKNTEDWRAIVHPDDQDQAFGEWYERFAANEMFEGEFRLKHKNGVWRWVQANAVTVGQGNDTRWFGTLTDIDEDRRATEQIAILNRELSHRIKNIFAVVSSLVALSSRNQPELTDFAEELNGKITALGRAHDFVRPIDNAKGEFLGGLLQELMAPYGTGDQARVIVSSADIPIGVSSATPLALVFHELATNSAKYGALSAADGTVSINVSSNDDQVTIVWAEHDGPPIEESTHRGFGSRLVEMSVKGQLQGSMERDWKPEGLVVTLTVPQVAISG